MLLRFSIGVNDRDLPLLTKINNTLKIGRLNFRHGAESVQWYVVNLNEVGILINFLEKYPLITQKRADYLLWQKAYEYLKNKEHLTEKGLKKIISLSAVSNRGLSDKVKKAHPDVVVVARPIVKDQIIKNPSWLAGFTAAEGCFLIKISKSETKIGWAVQLVFQLTQHCRDELLIRSLQNYFNCGHVTKNREAFDFRITKFEDNVNKIIPFFKNYRIEGVKALDFEDWCQAAELMKQKKHFIKEEIEQFRLIKAGMNKGRK